MLIFKSEKKFVFFFFFTTCQQTSFKELVTWMNFVPLKIYEDLEF